MDEQQVKTELADSEPERRGGPWKLIVLVAIATLVGVWLVPSEPPQQPTISTGGEQLLPDQGDPLPADQLPIDDDQLPSLLENLPATAAGGEPVLPDAMQQEMIDDRPGARARALIAGMRVRGDIQLDEIFTAAQQAHTDGEVADAYLLYFFAAREGHAPSAVALGNQADPATRDPNDSLFENADLNQAHKWYRIAVENGDPEGRERLAELRQRIEEKAADGDSQAKRIALQWQ